MKIEIAKTFICILLSVVLFKDPAYILRGVLGNGLEVNGDSAARKVFEHGGVRIVERDVLEHDLAIGRTTEASDLDRGHLDTAIDDFLHGSEIREKQQDLACAEFFVFVRLDRLKYGHTADLDALGRTHQIDAAHEFVVGKIVAHDDDLVCLRLIDPFGHYLTMDQTRIDSAEYDFGHVTHPFDTKSPTPCAGHVQQFSLSSCGCEMLRCRSHGSPDICHDVAAGALSDFQQLVDIELVLELKLGARFEKQRCGQPADNADSGLVTYFRGDV